MKEINMDDVLKRAGNVGGAPSWICPNCGNGSGPDKTGIQEDKNRAGKYHCFKCGLDGDVYDMRDAALRLTSGTSFKEYAAGTHPAAVRKTQKTQPTHEAQKADTTRAAYIEKCAAALKGSAGEAYLQGRGFNAETIARFRLGYDASIKAVVIPYPDTDYYITRSIAGKEYRKPNGTTEPIFNAAALAADDVFIMEGQLDAISIMQTGRAAAAIGGGGERKLIEYGGALPSRAVIIADNDDAGERTAQRIKSALETRHVAAYVVHPPREYKDANDLLKSDYATLQRLTAGNTWRNREYSKETSAAAYVSAFWNDAKNRTPATLTGFSNLDKALGGGIYEGLYIVGAVSSLGKTTFCLQMAEQIAEQGRDVIIFSLEMARAELIAKSLSRMTLQLCEGQISNAKTARALLDPAKLNACNEKEQFIITCATEKYATNARTLWINEGLGTIGTEQIRQAIEAHRAITGNIPVVFIDYLQILQSPDARLSDKQATDKNVFELKRISRDYKAAIIAISSFNRENYAAALNMTAFKESGAIEYSSDVLIGIQPQGMTQGSGEQARTENAQTMEACKQGDTRDVEIKILKNRHGRTGATVLYRYYPMFNYFVEQPDED